MLSRSAVWRRERFQISRKEKRDAMGLASWAWELRGCFFLTLNLSLNQ